MIIRSCTATFCSIDSRLFTAQLSFEPRDSSLKGLVRGLLNFGGVALQDLTPLWVTFL